MNYRLTKKLSLTGDNTRLYWTLRALARSGFYVTDDAETHIDITDKGWELNGKIHPDIETLLNELAGFTEI